MYFACGFPNLEGLELIFKGDGINFGKCALNENILASRDDGYLLKITH